MMNIDSIRIENSTVLVFSSNIGKRAISMSYISCVFFNYDSMEIIKKDTAIGAGILSTKISHFDIFDLPAGAKNRFEHNDPIFFYVKFHSKDQVNQKKITDNFLFIIGPINGTLFSLPISNPYILRVIEDYLKDNNLKKFLKLIESGSLL